MGITAPSYSSGYTPGTLAAHQTQQEQAMSPDVAALNAKFQQLPAYQNYVSLLNRPHSAAEQQQAASALAAQGNALNIPNSMIFDPYTGVVRDKTWGEQNSNWSALLYSGAAIGAGLAGGAAAGALGASGAGASAGAAGAGTGLGETGAVTGLAGSGFGTGAGLGITSPLSSAIAGGGTLASNAGATGIGSLASGSAGSGGIGGAAAGVGAGTAATGGSALGTAAKLGLGALGPALSALGTAQQGAANRQETAAQSATNQISSQSQQDRANAQAAATPLGQDQNFAAKNALLSQFLGNMRNIHYSQGNSPTAQGGVLPANGLDPALLNSLYGPQATLASLSQHEQQLSAINPQAPAMDLSAIGGFGSTAQPAMSDIANYQSQQAGKQDAQRNLIQNYINAGLSGNYGALNSAIVGTGGKGNS